MQNLFVYGTLQFPELVKKLTGKTFTGRPAVLNRYRRRSVKDADYPAIVPDSEAQTQGILYEGVDRESLKKIDFFEGSEYKKEVVLVDINGKEIEALAYIWKGPAEALNENDWDHARFEKYSLSAYLN